MRHLGQLTVVVDLVEDQTQGIGVQGGVGAEHFVLKFRSGVGAAVLGGQCSQIQTGQGHQTQIADAVFPVFGNEDVGRLQIHIDPSGPAGGGQGIAHIDTQIQGTQLGHIIPADIFFQGLAVAAEQIYLIAQVTMLHGNGLPAFEGQEALQPGQVLQALGFRIHAVSQFPEIFQCGGRLPEGTGEQQRIHLGLGCGDRNNFNDVFFFRVFLQCRIAADTVVLAEGCAHGKIIQQRGDKFRFRQSQSPPYTRISYTKITKIATCIYADLIKC